MAMVRSSRRQMRLATDWWRTTSASAERRTYFLAASCFSTDVLKRLQAKKGGTQDENRRSEEREWMGNKYLVHFFDYERGGNKYLIWGLTAGILVRAASAVYRRPPAFLEQYSDFRLPKVMPKGH